MPPFAGFVRLFVIICTSVFTLQTIAAYGPFDNSALSNSLTRFFGLVPALVFRGAIHQLFTWVFLHGNLTHLLFNLFSFWMFGSLLESVMGSRKFAMFTLASGVFTAIIISLVGIIDSNTFYATTIGASGVVFAILVAVSMMFPNQTVLFFFIFPMKMKVFACVMIAIEFYMLYTSNNHGVSNLAHLSGALVGFLFIRFSGSRLKPSWIRTWIDQWKQRRLRKKLRVVRSEDRRTYH